ncbi:MAG: hypothetical protein KC613_17065 [Myxococcales bacterium]|nr:hypothetical protein [Myxococcales bacterium]
MTKRKTAAEYVAELDAAIDAFQAKAIDYAEMSKRMGETWDAVRARGNRFHAGVLKHLRNRGGRA